MPLYPRLGAIEWAEGPNNESDSACGNIGTDNPPGTPAYVAYQFSVAPCPAGDAACAAACAASDAACVAYAQNNLVDCVDLCFKRMNTNFLECPGDSWCDASNPNPDALGKPWVIYSKPHPVDGKSPADALVGTVRSDAAVFLKNSVFAQMPVTMDDAAVLGNRAFFIRVNRVARDTGDPVTLLPESGVAYAPRFLAPGVNETQTWFEIWGALGVAPGGALGVPAVDPTKPFTGSDVCSQGTRVSFGGFAGYYGLGPRPSCTRGDQAQFYASFFTKTELQFQTTLQAKLAAADRHFAWKNGTVGGTCQPTRVFFNSHPYSLGNAGQPGRIYINPDDFVGAFDTSTDPFANGPFNSAFDIYRLGSHEYFHQLRRRWQVDQPAGGPHSALLDEEMADTVTFRPCLALDPNNANKCVSGVKGRPVGGHGQGSLVNYEVNPRLNALFLDYNGAAFQLYAEEQYSYPLVVSADPTYPRGAGAVGDSISARPGVPPGVADGAPLPTAGRRSDEGMDLLGLILQTFDGATAGETTPALLDKAYKTHLDRPFDEMVLDFHTALFLKDYNSVDAAGVARYPRWRFEWDGHGDGAASETDKPYEPTAARTVPFGHLHTLRDLDSYSCTTLGCAKLPGGFSKRLVVGTTDTYSGDSSLFAYGAAAWSAKPAPQWVDPVTGKGSVPFVAFGYKVAPRFRAFRIDAQQAGAKVKLVPTPVCGTPPRFECAVVPSVDGSGSWKLAVSIPVEASTDEVLVVASTLADDAQLGWRLGIGKPEVKILKPTTVIPQWLGHPSTTVYPAQVFATYRAPDLTPLPVGPAANVTLEVVDCVGTPNLKLTGADIAVLPLSNGLFSVLANIPAVCFSAAAPFQNLDIRVIVDGTMSVTQVDALTVSTSAFSLATALVVDQSGSMVGNKIAGARVAAKAIIDSLVPATGAQTPRWLNLVGFSDNATTIQLGAPNEYGWVQVDSGNKAGAQAAVDALAAGGFTSVGDGMFEAQSNLACRFQPGPAGATPPVVDQQDMVVLSDGLNNRPQDPFKYYKDGNGYTPEAGVPPWCPTTLQWPARVAQGYKVPRVNSIVYGQDADYSSLYEAAEITGGVAMPAPKPTSTPIGAISSFTDGMLAALNETDGTQRVAFGQIAGESDQFIVVDAFASELRVVVAAESVTPSDQLVLIHETSGIVVPVESRGTNSLAVKVPSPAPGVWKLAFDFPGKELYYEAAVTSGAKLITYVNPGAFPEGTPAVLKATAGVGSGPPSFTAAVFGPSGILRDCAINALLTSPSGAVSSHALADIGKGVDGGLRDGVFGLSVPLAPLPGVYTVYFAAVCHDGNLKPLWRQGRRGFVLSAGADADGDGMPDAWEITHGLNPANPADAASDLDEDGLNALAELRAGTDPTLADTDGGGEADGSELARGANPLTKDDDAVAPPTFKVRWGDTGAAVFLGAAYDGHGIELQTSVATGAWAPARATTVENARIVPATRGVPTCVRVRVSLGAASGAWSAPTCGTPGSDTFPPRIVGATGVRHGRWVVPEIAVEDELPHALRGAVGAAIGVSTPGRIDVRIDTSATPTTAWVPYVGPGTKLRVARSARHANTFWMQARDEAGNVSPPIAIHVPTRAETLVDKAIELEEDAQDETVESLAKKKVKRSIPRLDLARTLAKQATTDPAIRAAIDDLVDRALARKAQAVLRIKAHDLPAARREVEIALGLEEELARLLDRIGAADPDRPFDEDNP